MSVQQNCFTPFFQKICALYWITAILMPVKLGQLLMMMMTKILMRRKKRMRVKIFMKMMGQLSANPHHHKEHYPMSHKQAHLQDHYEQAATCQTLYGALHRGTDPLLIKTSRKWV